MAKHGEPEQKLKERGQDAPPKVEDAAEPTAAAERIPQPRPSPRVKATQPLPPPAGPPPAAEPPQPPAVRLEVFCRITGTKWDRLAAFKHWIRKQKIGPLPIKGWWKELEKFQKRPVG